MQFVNVISQVPNNPIRRDTALASINQTGATLISIIGGLNQKDFGFFTLLKTAREFRDFRDSFATPVNGKLFGDSGGYSVIKGDVHPEDIPRFIPCYIKFFELEHHTVNTFFSLDIPIFIKPEFQDFNTIANINEFNRQSLVESKELMEKDPEIRQKFSYVWHFKIPEQYRIFSQLYDELELSKLIMRRSIGGMVGLPKKTAIRFAPFIALAYRCLLDHLKGAYPEEPFTLHMLGIKSKTDRFAMALIEQLFRRYLKDTADVKVTYDSININRNTQYNVRNVKFFSLEDDTLNEYRNVFALPQDIIESVYFTDSMEDHFRAELENLKNGKKMLSADSFAPLAIHSEVFIDRYFSKVVESYEVVDAFFRSTSVIQVKAHLKNMMLKLSLEEPSIFTKKFLQAFIENVEWIFAFHRWFILKRDRVSLDELIFEFIQEINFPFRLG